MPQVGDQCTWTDRKSLWRLKVRNVSGKIYNLVFKIRSFFRVENIKCHLSLTVEICRILTLNNYLTFEKYFVL